MYCVCASRLRAIKVTKYTADPFLTERIEQSAMGWEPSPGSLRKSRGYSRRCAYRKLDFQRLLCVSWAVWTMDKRSIEKKAKKEREREAQSGGKSGTG